MALDWQVSKSSHRCALTDRELEIGEVYYSALVEDKDSFVRRDYSCDAWAEVEKSNFFSFWKTKVHTEDEKKKLVIDIEAFYTFFANLAQAEDESKAVFLYLVALILTRKRVLRLDEIEKGPDCDYLVIYDRRGDNTFHIACPEVTEAQLTDAQEQLNQIFECQLDSDEI